MTILTWLLVGGAWAALVGMARWPWTLADWVLIAIRFRVGECDLRGRSFEVAWYEAVRASGMPDRVASLLRPRPHPDDRRGARRRADR